MDARLARAALAVAIGVSLGASHRTPNFLVTAPTLEFAEEVGRTAEILRQDLAVSWLGKALPRWKQPCPIEVQVAPQMGAGGVTSFFFERGEVFGWRMSIQGSRERILDSVLPHEVTHTIFASHFRQALPRWADEGACTTVEHPSERARQQRMLIEFLRHRRGIPFNQMFAMREYPRDVLPLYAQGHSLASYLIAQGGRRKFIDFLAQGLSDDNWPAAMDQFYRFDNLAGLQSTWLDWVRQGSPRLAPSTNEDALATNEPEQVDPGSADFNLEPRREPARNVLAISDESTSELSADDMETLVSPRDRRPNGATAMPDEKSVAAWQPPTARGRTGSSVYARNRPGRTSIEPEQVTRPQPVQPARQQVIQWDEGPREPSPSRPSKGSVYGRRAKP